MPYFGGKGRMAHFIADRLDYTTDTFVTIFGGGCRVLLNKPHHTNEIYNDYGSGVCAVMEVLSKPDTAQEFIDRLYYETEYISDEQAKEQFEQAKKIYDFCETDLEQQYRNQLKQLLMSKGIISAIYANKFIEYIRCEAYETALVPTKYVYKSKEKLKEELQRDNEFKGKFQTTFGDWLTFYGIRTENEKNGYIPRSRDIEINKVESTSTKTDEEIDQEHVYTLSADALTLVDYIKSITDMDLAIATYIVFTFGFSGTGQGYTKGKFKNDDDYKKHILKLYPCAERMQGVQVYQFDAMSFFSQDLYENVMHEKAYQRSVFFQWLLNPDVMMLCDPSYIDPGHEARLLHDEETGIDIDVSKVDSVSEAIRQAWDGKKMPSNLGKCYTRSFGYEEQEKFLEAIQYADCKMLICNYDLALYDKYLNEETGWTKEVYPTTTSASGTSGNNERLECIWYNY